MTEAEQILESADGVLVVDWPSRDVPDTLVGAGYDVVVKGGPGPDDYSAHELRDGRVVVAPLGRPPARVELVYCHRPPEELPGILAVAKAIGARAVWYQSGLAPGGAKDPMGCWVAEQASRDARGLVESAGLRYIDDVYIADAVRHLQVRKQAGR